MNGRIYNFLLVSRSDDESAGKIVVEIERNKLYKVSRASTSQDALAKLVNVNCLVYNFESFNGAKTKLATNMRDLGYRFPIIIFANYVDREAYDIVRKMEKTVIIEKPFESKDVWGICQKILQGRKVNQRIFRRYYTLQSAAMEKTTSGETITGQIFNLSRGGAYIELGKGRLTPGEMVKVCISLDKISRQYNVDAEVVWATSKGYANGKPAAGLRFVQADDVYRNLLHKL